MSLTLTSSPSKPLNNDLTDRHLPHYIIVFSHLRWDFVYQRPQHLLSRFSADFKIIFIEEPIYDAQDTAHYKQSIISSTITKIVPHLPPNLSAEQGTAQQVSLFDLLMQNKDIEDYAFWYYTPMALEFTRKYYPNLVIFDCMDELSAFKFAPASLKALEQELLNKADVVFTGGNSLYEAKKHQHHNIHSFPSSIEAAHFNKARALQSSPADQIVTTKPTLGFYGVIDERFDTDIIKGMADAHPDWEIVLIGPVVKIDPATLPKNDNIHFLGSKTYAELPLYMATWDIALIPFLLNESTRFISPTKTPEYLAAGLPVISTPIKDVVAPYGDNNLVYIGSNATEFIAAAEKELQKPEADRLAWLKKTDAFLALNSWDKTYNKMLRLVEQVISNKSQTAISR